MSTIDPSTAAQQLATAYIQGAQSQVTAQTKAAQTTASGLTSLQTALSNFQTALKGLSSVTSSAGGVRAYSATFDVSGVATASASSSAEAGTYQFFVQQLATANQIVFQNLPAIPVSGGGPLVLTLADGSAINVDLVAADTDHDGTITQTEIARAINQASNNAGKVSASVVTVNGQSQLLLTAGSTGAASAITVDTSGLPASALKTALAAGQVLTPAQDAIVWLGGQGGVKLQQASNTFTGVDGVNITFTRAQSATDAPVTLTVASDDSTTAANVQKFVDAYNTLKTALDNLTKLGTASSSGGALASDPGITALRTHVNQLIRQTYSGQSLIALGVSASRDGTLTLDQTRMKAALTSNPDALAQVFGNAGVVNNTGMLGALNKYLDGWTNSASGQISSRQNTVQALQKRLTARQTRITDQYNNMYQVYLKQFAQVQALQNSMSQTSGLFASSSS